MWPFASPRNPYDETIKAKRSRRADAVEHAPVFSAEKHQKYLDVTGTDPSFSLHCKGRWLTDWFWGVRSITDCGEHTGWNVDGVGSAGGLYCARGASAAGDELPH